MTNEERILVTLARVEEHAKFSREKLEKMDNRLTKAEEKVLKHENVINKALGFIVAVPIFVGGLSHHLSKAFAGMFH